MIKFGPKAQLTANIDNWGGYYTERAQDVLDGNWKSDDTWGGLDVGHGRDGALSPTCPTT